MHNEFEVHILNGGADRCNPFSGAEGNRIRIAVNRNPEDVFITG